MRVLEKFFDEAVNVIIVGLLLFCIGVVLTGFTSIFAVGYLWDLLVNFFLIAGICGGAITFTVGIYLLLKDTLDFGDI